MESWDILLEIVVLLGAALLLGGTLARFRLSPLPGYLLAGMVLGGPGSLGVVRSEDHIESIAGIGVALLVFGIGLEFPGSRLKAVGGRMFAATALQVVLTILVATLAALAFGFALPEAVVLGAIVTLSSTAAIQRVLADGGEADSGHGREALALSVLQDLAVIPLALLVDALGEGTGERSPWLSLLTVGALGAGFAFVLWGLLRFGAAPALRQLSLERNRELTVVLAVVVGLGATWGSHAIGLSPALGAFVAGVFIGGSPFASQVRADISSIRIVLLTLFFAAVGMLANPLWILANLPSLLGITLLVVVVKAALAAGVLRGLGSPARTAVAAGICLVPISEFSFVLATAAADSGVLEAETHMAAVSVAILTLFAAPPLIAVAPRVAALRPGRRGGRPRGGPAPAANPRPAPEVVVVGYGPAGRAVGDALSARGRKILVIDINPAARRDAEAAGLTGEIGDAQDVDVLERFGVGSATLVVITLPGRTAALTVLAHVRRLAPAATVVVRSRHQLHRREFEAGGAHAVAGDEEQVGEELARLAEGALPRAGADAESGAEAAAEADAGPGAAAGPGGSPPA